MVLLHVPAGSRPLHLVPPPTRTGAAGAAQVCGLLGPEMNTGPNHSLSPESVARCCMPQGYAAAWECADAYASGLCWLLGLGPDRSPIVAADPGPGAARSGRAGPLNVALGRAGPLNEAWAVAVYLG